jgi:hypothetical protein
MVATEPKFTKGDTVAELEEGATAGLADTITPPLRI